MCIYAAIKNGIYIFSEINLDFFSDVMEPIVFDLTLVRHGRTDANRQGIVQGHVDTPLDQLGIIQVVFALTRGN